MGIRLKISATLLPNTDNAQLSVMNDIICLVSQQLSVRLTDSHLDTAKGSLVVGFEVLNGDARVTTAKDVLRYYAESHAGKVQSLDFSEITQT